MRKLISAVLLIMLLVCSSCAKSSNENMIGEEEYKKTIAQLENDLLTLKEEQAQIDAEREKKILELTQKLEMLNNKNNEEKDTESSDADLPEGFKYSVINNEASITGYNGKDVEIVIPASIDGYRVTSIADNAFEDTAIKSVVIPDGVKKVGWFAFNGCMELRRITVPSSVTEIGYSAFGNAGSSLTVYCHSGSYALAFAKSFGLTYAIV